MTRFLTEHISSGWANENDYEHRHNVLVHITMTNPPEGLPIMLQGLDDRDQTLKETAYIALYSYLWQGYHMPDSLLRRMKDEVESRINHRIRRWAMSLVEKANPPGFTEWLIPIAEDDPDWEIRRPAMLRLLDSGDISQLHRLIAEIPFHDEPPWLARRLWERHRAELTAEEEDVARTAIINEMDSLRSSHDRWTRSRNRRRRRRWRTEDNYLPSLCELIRKGFPPVSEDARRIEEFVEAHHRARKGTRVAAVGTLALIPGPSSLDVARSLTGSRFKGVRDAAAKILGQVSAP